MTAAVPSRWLVRTVGGALFVLTMVVALVAQRDVGLARDELVYMGAGDGYARWWIDAAHLKSGIASETSITATFGGPGVTDHNREHPPFMKTLFGLSKRLLHDRLGVASLTTAYRAPSALMAAVMVLVVFAWVLAAWGFAPAVVAALLTLFLPRALFHAGLACFDGPIAALWLATLYGYWRGLSRRRWAWIAGVIWGLALATKHNALLLPFAIAPHFVVVIMREAWPQARGRGVARVGRAIGGGLLRHWPTPVALIVLGPLTLVAVWPWLWFHPIAHVQAWLHFHTTHLHYNFEYLGDNWNHPRFPWHVAIVTTLFTVPATTLVAALVGATAHGRVWWRDRRAVSTEPGLLLVLSLAASMGPFLLGSTPIFGAEKHWEAAVPSLCIAAGLGVVWAARTAVAAAAEQWPIAHRRGAAAITTAAIAMLVIGAAAIETVHANPYALSSYNALAGGAPGGADLGMNRQFWGYSARGVLPFLRSRAPGPGQATRPVYSHDASPAWGAYLRDHLLPTTEPDAGPEESGISRSHFAIVIHERHFRRHDFMIWSSYGTVAPVFVLRVDGVPIVSVYERPPPP